MKGIRKDNGRNEGRKYMYEDGKEEERKGKRE
jgi:hypothetical protein